MVDGRGVGVLTLYARRVQAQQVTQKRRNVRLVEHNEVLHPVAVAFGHKGRVVGKPVGDITVLPAAFVLERLRQVPMVQAEPGRDARPQKRVDKPVVEVAAFGIGPPAPLGEEAAPGGRKAVGI